MSFGILFWDEIRGFIKSKIMFALWIGLPLLSLLMHFIQPDTEGISVTIFTSLLLASFGGLLVAVMLSTSIVNDRNSKAFDLFLIRPVKRWHLIISKFVAVFLCVTIASLLSIIIGIIIDYATLSIPITQIIIEAMKSLAIALVAMTIAGSLGILLGILINSVALAAILAFYLGEQLSALVVMPSFFITTFDPTWLSVGIGLAISAILLIVDVIIFNKKQF